MIFPGEKEAVIAVIKLGKKYGYGNLIAHLKRAWALDHEQKYGHPFETSPLNEDGYPRDCYLLTDEETKKLVR